MPWDHVPNLQSQAFHFVSCGCQTKVEGLVMCLRNLQFIILYPPSLCESQTTLQTGAAQLSTHIHYIQETTTNHLQEMVKSAETCISSFFRCTCIVCSVYVGKACKLNLCWNVCIDWSARKFLMLAQMCSDFSAWVWAYAQFSSLHMCLYSQHTVKDTSCTSCSEVTNVHVFQSTHLGYVPMRSMLPCRGWPLKHLSLTSSVKVYTCGLCSKAIEYLWKHFLVPEE